MMNTQSTRHEEHGQALCIGHAQGAQRLWEDRRKKRWLLLLRGIQECRRRSVQ
jgi:hypothetical protein